MKREDGYYWIKKSVEHKKTLPDEKEEPLNIYCNCYKQKKEDKEKGFCTQCEKLIISHEKLQSDKRKAR